MVKKKKKRILKILKREGSTYRKVVAFSLKKKIPQKGEKVGAGLTFRNMYDPTIRRHAKFIIAKI